MERLRLGGREERGREFKTVKWTVCTCFFPTRDTDGRNHCPPALLHSSHARDRWMLCAPESGPDHSVQRRQGRRQTGRNQLSGHGPCGRAPRVAVHCRTPEWRRATPRAQSLLSVRPPAAGALSSPIALAPPVPRHVLPLALRLASALGAPLLRSGNHSSLFLRPLLGDGCSPSRCHGHRGGPHTHWRSAGRLVDPPHSCRTAAGWAHDHCQWPLTLSRAGAASIAAAAAAPIEALLGPRVPDEVQGRQRMVSCRTLPMSCSLHR